MDFDKPKVYGDTSITDGLVLLGNVPFVRGLRPCFIKLFQSDSEFSLSRVNFPIYLPLLLGFIKPLSLCSEQNFSHKI